MFGPDFQVKVELLPCGEHEGFNLEIVGNFRVPTRDLILGLWESLKRKLPPRNMRRKSMWSRPCRVVARKTLRLLLLLLWCRRQQVVVSDTLEGLGVPCGGAAAGGISTGSKPAGEKKRKPEEKDAASGEKKRRRIQTKRPTGATQKKPAVVAEPQDKDFSIFDAPPSPPRATAADAGVSKEFLVPFVKVVPNPSAQAEDTVGKTASQIFDTVDSSDNLVTPNDADDLDLRFSDGDKRKTDAEKHKSPATEKVSGSASGGAGYEGPPIQPVESELEYYYRTYTEDQAVTYHRPPWSVLQGVIFQIILLSARRFWVV
ncbi:hypothetical protein Hdeb2414_s0014g00429781 [Helianthus debilis subsp. tardiflorus]